MWAASSMVMDSRRAAPPDNTAIKISRHRATASCNRVGGRRLPLGVIDSATSPTQDAGTNYRREGTSSKTVMTEWSGIRESNPRLDLGKVAYYHYTNPARELFIARRERAEQERVP